MTPRTLFTIILKVFGLFFFRELITNTVDFIVSVSNLTKSGLAIDSNSMEFTISIYILPACIIILYVLIIYLLLFKTIKIMDILKLDHGFTQEIFSSTIQTPFILTISLIVLGGVILTTEVPTLFKNIFTYFQEKHLAAFSMIKFNYSYIIISSVKIIIALVLLGERKRIVSFLEKQRS